VNRVELFQKLVASLKENQAVHDKIFSIISQEVTSVWDAAVITAMIGAWTAQAFGKEAFLELFETLYTSSSGLASRKRAVLRQRYCGCPCALHPSTVLCLCPCANHPRPEG
jgi:hypothetical protein